MDKLVGVAAPETEMEKRLDCLLKKESAKVRNLTEVVAILWRSLCAIRDMVDTVDHPFADPPPHAAVRAAVDAAIAEARPRISPPLRART